MYEYRVMEDRGGYTFYLRDEVLAHVSDLDELEVELISEGVEGWVYEDRNGIETLVYGPYVDELDRF